MATLKQKILDLLQEEFGEYSYLEVKEQVSWVTLEKKAEFIRDIQSLCNSLASEPSRYLVIGYNKHKKTFKDVENYQKFDDGKLVSMLSAYFEPEITFRTHAFTNNEGGNFVVMEFPTNKLSSPHIIKKEIKQQGKEPILNIGEIWIKGGGIGGSSSKRRATRSDLYEMFDLYIERQIEKRTQLRVTEAMKTKQVGVIARELLLPENFDISLIYKEDEVFLNIVKQIILGEKSTFLRELIESLRQNILGSWKKIKYNAVKPEDLEKLFDLANDVKNNQIQPSMRKLTLLGIQLVKTRSYPSIFESLLQILAEFYSYGYKSEYGIRSIQNIKYPNENLSFSLPALESMSAFNLLGAYASKVNNSSYLSKIINLKTKWEDGYESRFMIFQHASGKEEYSAIPELINPDGKTYKNLINYYSEKGNCLISYAFDDTDDLSSWLACFDLIKEFNSHALIYAWVAQQKLKEVEFNKARAQFPEGTPEYKINDLRSEMLDEYNYYQSPFTYFASFLNLDSSRVVGILERFIDLFQKRNLSELKNYFVNDKHSTVNYDQFDKFIFEGIDDIKKQRDQTYHFASFFGWFGKEVDNFLKATTKKYNYGQ